MRTVEIFRIKQKPVYISMELDMVDITFVFFSITVLIAIAGCICGLIAHGIMKIYSKRRGKKVE